MRPASPRSTFGMVPSGVLLGMLLILAGCFTPFGIYHRVEQGQTLYRISTVYGVSLDKLLKLNRIEDPTELYPGDLVFVPGANRPREVPTTSQAGRRADGGETTRGRDRGREQAVRLDPDGPSSGAKEKERPERSPDGPRLIWPLDGKVTGPYGKRGDGAHDGIDVSADRGTSVKAAADGRVIYSDDKLSGYGNLVIVRHGGCWATVYAHNDENLVAKGDFVSQGQVVARVGETGRTSGPHLHFEVRCGKVPKDPLQYLPQPQTARR